MEFEKELSVQETGIEGLKVVELAVHGDPRGWFKENWQRAKMVALGIPDMRVVQNNVSFNARRGVTRGVHAEPWDKFVSVAAGSVFGAWVDLRQGSATYGRVYTCTLDPSRAIYVPRGVGNSFQALEDGTAYTYLVDAHWSAELKRTYTFVSLADPALGIEWPIPLSEATLSEADRHHPMLADVVPMAPRRTLVTGCRGQLGRAVRALAEERGILDTFDFCDIDAFDLSDPDAYSQYDWDLYGTVINCGAYTAVDGAETPEGRLSAWAANATGPALLARTCAEHGITLVHVSSDYVFDGTREVHDEGSPSPSPSTASPRPRATTSPSRDAPGTISCAPAGSWATAQLRAHHGGALRPRGGPGRPPGPRRRGGRPAGPPHLHARHGRRDPPPAGVPRPRTAPTTARAPGASPAGRRSPARSSTSGTATGTRWRPSRPREYYAGAEGPRRPAPGALGPRPLPSRLEATGFSMPDWEQSLREYVRGLA